jgi:AAA domain-containing protein
MTYQLRRAVREAGYILLALAGPSGSGKTYSALRIATGLSYGKRFAVIDTEARRATHYVPPFDFDHLDLGAPFSPENYHKALKVCAEAQAPVIVVDSMSHEWDGEGGLSEMHGEILEERVERALKRNPNADEWQIREALNIGCWREPKLEHKRLMARLLQLRAHVIFCLRAEEKIKFVAVKEEGQGAGGRERQAPVNAGWQPICEKRFMYEMTASFLLSPEQPGIAKAIKLQAQHAPFFDLTSPLDERAGEMLARWARGGGEPARAAAPPSPAPKPPAGPPPARVNPAPAAGPEPPSYAIADAIAMVTKMGGGKLRAAELEHAFAPGCKTQTSLGLYAKSSPEDYRRCFEDLHRLFLRWKDEH